jgi:hypothetical protein
VNKNKKGNEKMPDFDKLSDRMIVEPSDSPFLVVKTNLDSKDVTEDNPYYNKDNKEASDTFKQYFEQE